jgi:hypothetical protein
MWQALEAYHGFVYFAPEADTEYLGVGLDAGMMGYFASRAAPMGAVTADVVVATFFNFEPSGVHAVIPEAWQRADPTGVTAARLRAVDAGLRRMLGDRLGEPDVAEAAELARRAADACRPEGRPLYAGHRTLEWPDEPHLALWHAITLLREYRGDGHVAALTAQGLSGIEALVVHGATGAVPPSVLQNTRAWSDAAWASAVEGLTARGVLADDGSLTDSGGAQRAWVEERTDALAAAPWAALGDDGCSALMATGKSLSRLLLAADAFSRPLR